MADFTEKIRYEADITDVLAKQQRMAQSADAAGDAQDKAAAKASRSWTEFAAGLETRGRQLRNTGLVMTAAITAPIVLGAKQASDAAVDLGESMNKVNVVFGDSAGELQAWASTADRSLGLSERAALEAAGTFGNLFTSMGLVPSAANDMSQQVVQLASDLGSFNNVDPSEMLDKLRSGLVGEVEPLRAVGINLNAAAVEAKALELGLASASGEVSEAAKVQARLALITEQSSNATGDFARTSGDAANAGRILSARYANMQADIGQRLVPAKLKLLEVGSDLLDMWEETPGPMQNVALGMAGIAAAAGPTLTTVGQMAIGVSHLTKAMADNTSRMSRMVSFMTGPWGIALAGATIAAGLWAKSKADANRRVDELASTLDEATGALTDNTRAIVVNRLEEEGAIEAARGLGLSMRDVVEAALGNESAMNRVTAATTAAMAAADDHRQLMGEDRDAIVGADDAAALLTESLGLLVPELDKAQESARRKASTMAELDGEVVDLTDAIARGLDPHLAALALRYREAATAGDENTESTEGQAEALKVYGEAVDKFVDTADVYFGLLDTKQQAERESAEETAKAAGKGAEAWEEFATDATVSLGEYADALEDQLEAMENWQLNLGVIASRAGEDVAAHFAAMGPEAAGLVAEMATAVGPEFDRLVELIRQDMEAAGLAGGEGFKRGLEAMYDRVIASSSLMARQAAQATRDELQEQSPSKVFWQIAADAVKGAELGFLDNADSLEDAATSVFQKVLAGVKDITGGIGAIFGAGDARDAVGEAAEHLEALLRKQEALPTDIGIVTGQVERARERAQAVTPEEEADIIRARQRVARAEQDLADTRGDAEASADDLRLAELEVAAARQRLTEAEKEAAGPTRELIELQEQLRDLKSENAHIDEEIEDAREALTRAELRAIDAEAGLLTAGQDLIDLTPAQEAMFQQLADAAGIPLGALQNLITAYERLAQVSTGINQEVVGGTQQGLAERIAGMRAGVGLDPDPISDRVWVEGVAAGTHDLANLQRRLEQRAREEGVLRNGKSGNTYQLNVNTSEARVDEFAAARLFGRMETLAGAPGG